MINYTTKHRNHEEFNKNCPACLKELVADQGRLVNTLYDRFDYLHGILSASSNEPEQVEKLFQHLEEKFPPLGRGPTYLLLEGELKASTPHGKHS